jgi:hypothetical protein
VSARRPGLGEVLAVWSLFALVGVATLVTYSRLPADALYHVSESGLDGGLGRSLVYLNFPVALVALAVLPVVLERLWGEARNSLLLAASACAAALCLVVIVPGVVDEDDLDAKAVNAVPALGVALVAALTVLALRAGGLGLVARRAPLDRARLVCGLALLAVSLPWIWAELGFYISDAPLLGRVFLAEELRPEAGEPGLRAVHLGRHHGLDGALLAVAALLLSRVLPQMRRPALQQWLAFAVSALFVYGVLNVAQDFWLEQVVKRGTTGHRLPSFLRPELSAAWAFQLAAVAVLYAFVTRGLVRAGLQPGPGTMSKV